jgi:hypothetical protein
MHLDVLNQPIQVGDDVLVSSSVSSFPSLSKVIKLTPNKVTISSGVSKDPKTMVVINKQLEYARDTWPEYNI